MGRQVSASVWAAVAAAVASTFATIILGAIARRLRALSQSFERFMGEHSWLLATTLWTRDKTIRIMDSLGMPIEQPPPADLPPRPRLLNDLGCFT